MSDDSIYLSKHIDELIDSEFPQYSLLTESGFRRFLDDRGIYLRTKNLEHFEKEGFLLPVIRLRRPESGLAGQKYSGVSTDAYSLKRYKEGGFLEYPTCENFQEWDSYRDGYEKTVVMLYHPYQILILQKILSSVSSVLQYPLLEEKDEHSRYFEEIKDFYDQSKKYFFKVKPRFIKQVRLLFCLQNLFQPVYKSSYIPDWRGIEGNYERWQIWKEETFSATEILKRCTYTVEEIKNYRDWLAAQARFADPIKKFFMLFRLMPYRKRIDLSGKALLAQDYYEFNGILNLFLEDLTGEKQPDPDDIFDQRSGSWKKRVYGDPFDYSDPKIRRKIVEDYVRSSLPKLMLLVEGDTEEESIPIIADAMRFYFWANGVEIYNYEGTGGLKGQNIRGTIDTAKRHDTKCYIISDNDERAQDYIKDLLREGLIKKDEYTIWDKEYEEDNFSIEDILDIINLALQDHGIEILEKSHVEDELGKGKFLMKSIEDAFWQKQYTDIYYIIPKRKIGMLLGLKRAKQIEEEIQRGKFKPKLKIEQILMKVSDRL